MEMMHCVPKDEVLTILNAAGARIINVTRDGATGDLFESYHYIISHPGVPR
jgi:hypothetical protein